ncbi:hypothetical protein MRB53_001870 [Persea americana]|uniref:Uncharacterized protein n=1 Tax=Persea americana TaxID=3435 RepID=A0ACC2MSW0_PERAE|nr:hypothetical protein MRB53_001870 [Persea americana]
MEKEIRILESSCSQGRLLNYIVLEVLRRVLDAMDPHHPVEILFAESIRLYRMSKKAFILRKIYARGIKVLSVKDHWLGIEVLSVKAHWLET